MDKRQSLRILINHSFFLTDYQKKNLLNKINLFQKEEIELLGKLLAKEKRKSLDSAKQDIIYLEELKNLLIKYSNNQMHPQKT